MLSDFNTFKDNLTILNKTFLTLGKPMNVNNSNIIIRDTMSLAPSGKRSLEAIGSLYDINKINLTKEQKENMDILLLENKELF
jgi:hypothetical protein